MEGSDILAQTSFPELLSLHFPRIEGYRRGFCRPRLAVNGTHVKSRTGEWNDSVSSIKP